MPEGIITAKKRARRPSIQVAKRHGPRFGDFRLKSAYTIISYFAGCGGMDLGFLGGFTYQNQYFRRLPFRIVAAYDFDQDCVDTYKLNISDDILLADLSSLPPGLLPRAQVLIGGFPCQDFASCGPKQGLNSSRGRLYRAMIDYMVEKRPALVIGENVPHLSKIHGGGVFRTILKDIDEAGYACDVWRLFAPDYGVPQNRSRLFFVCVPKTVKEPRLPQQPPKNFTPHAYRPIDWAINDLINVTDEAVPNQSQFFVASKAKRGNGQGDETSKSGQPAYTVRANAKSRVQFHYSLDRRLTVRECARLQTFPDNFVFPHSATTNILQIGNAVPPILAYRVALSALAYLRNRQD